MKTYPLQSITIEEAMDLQFKAVDCITKEFPGHEILSRGDLGVVPGLNKPVMTMKAEKAIAGIFDAESSILVRGGRNRGNPLCAVCSDESGGNFAGAYGAYLQYHADNH